MTSDNEIGESFASLWLSYYIAVGTRFPPEQMIAQMSAFAHAMEATLLMFQEISDMDLPDEAGARILEKIFAEVTAQIRRTPLPPVKKRDSHKLS